MRSESDRVSRAGSFVLGLMNEADRRRAERDLEVDPVFREAVLGFTERLQVLDVVPRRNTGGAEQWKLVAARIAALPQMRGVVGGGSVPAGQARTTGRGLEQFQERWEPVFRPELRAKEMEDFRGSKKNGNAPYAVPSRQAALYVISLIAAFAAGYLAALWLM
jgi:hypothetical protein